MGAEGAAACLSSPLELSLGTRVGKKQFTSQQIEVQTPQLFLK